MISLNAMSPERHEIDKLVEAFRHHAEAICTEATDPELCQDMCEYWSANFVEWLGRQGVEADVIVCEGSRFSFPNHSWDHNVDFSEYWHVVARIGGWHIDWSRRQFDRAAPVPYITSERQANQDWKLVIERNAYSAIEAHYEERKAQAA